ncbi:MAG: ribonuclease P protein subunit [Thermoprotei archaeon]|nr:MAG: ribonuclease P protein subunit [Thermoprotei archaeon]
MRRTKSNLIYHELIGLRVHVKFHTDKSLINVKGRVVDETRNMLVVMTDEGREKKVPKFGGVFVFKLSDTVSVEVRGDSIVGRPEERLKRYGGGR